jgi:hypothetical protein
MGKTTQAKTNPLTKGLAIVFAIGLIYIFISVKDAPPPKRTIAASAPATAPIALTDQQKIDKQFSSIDGSHVQLEKMIKKIMNDPKSYQHVSSRYAQHQQTITVITEYRGSNALGAIINDSVTAQFSLDGQFIKMVN